MVLVCLVATMWLNMMSERLGKQKCHPRACITQKQDLISQLVVVHCSMGTLPALRNCDSPCISVKGFKDSNNYGLITTGVSKDINIVNSIAEVGNNRQY